MRAESHAKKDKHMQLRGEGHATKMIMGGNSTVVLWGRVYIRLYLYLRFRTFLVWFCLAVFRFRSNSSMLLLIKSERKHKLASSEMRKSGSCT